MPQVAVPWGREELTLDLPEHWTVEQVARPAVRAAGHNWPDRLAIALTQPNTGLSLPRLLAARRAGRTAIVIEDITRHSPLPDILQPVMREIRHAGIDLRQVEFVFATGMHRPMTPDQAGRKLGPLAEKVRWRCNPWPDRSAYLRVGRVAKMDVLVDRGVATADLRIVVSSLSPHLQAGFGGGYKMLIPGCAHLDTIRALHRQGIGPVPRQLVGLPAEKNPMRAAIDAAGKLIDGRHGKTFAIQYILDDTDRPSFIAAGEPIPTHQMLAKQCSVVNGVVVSAPADVLITNAHPRDFDLWQSLKCIPNTNWAVRPNGLILCLSRCEAGLFGMRVPPWPVSPAWTRRIVRLIGAEGICSLLTRSVPQLSSDAAFFVRMALQTLYRNPIFMASPTLYETAGRFPGMEIFPDAPAAIAAADERLKHRPQRVIVFPAGGITFPIPPSVGRAGK